jgi:hypothetical protein
MLTVRTVTVDESDEEDIWQPPHLLETDKIYPPTKCHSTVTFQYLCKLGAVWTSFPSTQVPQLMSFQIINESYNTVYSEDVRNINPAAIFRLEKKLRCFHEQLPSFLRVDDAANLQSCVPPHILCLK